MQKRFLKIATIVCVSLMFTYVSCTKDDGIIEESKPAVIRITLSDSQDSGTKAHSDDNDVAVTDAYAFILGGSGGVMDKFVVTQGVEKKTTTAAKSIIILGNVAALVTEFASVNTKADLDDVLGSFSNLLETKMWSHGSANLTFVDGAASDTESPLANVNLSLKPIASKINVTVNNTMTNWNPAKIELTGVALLYSAAYIHYVPDNSDIYIPSAAEVSAIPGIYYRSGITGWNSEDDDYTIPYTADSKLFELWDSEGLDDFKHSFYAFPSNGAHGKHPIVTVYGSYEGEDFYWPAHFSTNDLKTVLESGKKYNLTINLTGNVNNGGGGVIDPEETIESAFITITVSSTGWGTTVDLVKEIK